MDERTKAIISATVILIVNVVALFGIHVNQDTLMSVAFGIAAIIADIYGIWKNHNFTDEAALAQDYLDGMKGKRDE